VSAARDEMARLKSRTRLEVSAAGYRMGTAEASTPTVEMRSSAAEMRSSAAEVGTPTATHMAAAAPASAMASATTTAMASAATTAPAGTIGLSGTHRENRDRYHGQPLEGPADHFHVCHLAHHGGHSVATRLEAPARHSL
jgi:hypothetical protein